MNWAHNHSEGSNRAVCHLGTELSCFKTLASFYLWRKAIVCQTTGPPTPKSCPEEQQQWLLQERFQKKARAWWYLPREHPTWQRPWHKDHPRQKSCLGIALVGFLPIILSLCFIQRMANSPHQYDKAPGKVGEEKRHLSQLQRFCILWTLHLYIIERAICLDYKKVIFFPTTRPIMWGML